VLAAIVAFHELGHFVAARAQGIHVSKFSVGFGPSLLSWKVRRHISRRSRIPSEAD
jgi:membrane-associated protease RseP (regulator of RpoE activity)